MANVISKISLENIPYLLKDSEARTNIEELQTQMTDLQTALQNYITATAALVGGDA